MMQFGVRCAVVAVLGVSLAIFTSDDASANNFADLTVKEVMQQANGKDGVCKEIGAGLKLKEPNWENLQAKAKELVPLAKAMEKQDPPKGDKENWKKLTAAYTQAAEDLEKAAAAKDGKAASTAMKVLTACGPCHMAHRPKK